MILHYFVFFFSFAYLQACLGTHSNTIFLLGQRLFRQVVSVLNCSGHDSVIIQILILNSVKQHEMLTLNMKNEYFTCIDPSGMRNICLRWLNLIIQNNVPIIVFNKNMNSYKWFLSTGYLFLTVYYFEMYLCNVF